MGYDWPRHDPAAGSNSPIPRIHGFRQSGDPDHARESETADFFVGSSSQQAVNRIELIRQYWKSTKDLQVSTHPQRKLQREAASFSSCRVSLRLRGPIV